MAIKTLTGRKRHRVENDKLILQIEEETYTPQSPYSYDRESKIEWRDAKVEDVTLEEPEIKVVEQRMADICPNV